MGYSWIYSDGILGSIGGLYAHVGGSGGSTSWALLLYVFLRENTHKLDAGVRWGLLFSTEWGSLGEYRDGIFGTGLLNYFGEGKKIKGGKKRLCGAREKVYI